MASSGDPIKLTDTHTSGHLLAGFSVERDKNGTRLPGEQAHDSNAPGDWLAARNRKLRSAVGSLSPFGQGVREAG